MLIGPRRSLAGNHASKEVERKTRMESAPGSAYDRRHVRPHSNAGKLFIVEEPRETWWSLPLCVLMLAGLPSTSLAQLNNEVEELQGVIDAHVHVGPATALSISRTLDAIEAAQIAKRHGMRAIVFKQHYLETASWAYLVSRMVPGIQLFGGIALNRSVGGLNPNAVEQVATFAGGFGVSSTCRPSSPSTTTPGRQSRCRSQRTANCCPRCTRCSRSWPGTT